MGGMGGMGGWVVACSRRLSRLVVIHFRSFGDIMWFSVCRFYKNLC